MKIVLYYLTLPFFLTEYVLMTLFEGLMWLISSPSRAWAQIKEWL